MRLPLRSWKQVVESFLESFNDMNDTRYAKTCRHGRRTLIEQLEDRRVMAVTGALERARHDALSISSSLKASSFT